MIAATYEIIVNEHGRAIAIKCLECGMTSYHPVDISEKYCACCHEFHGHKADLKLIELWEKRLR